MLSLFPMPPTALILQAPLAATSKVKGIPGNLRGRTDIEALARALDGNVAAFMLTNPNTAGLFESDIRMICDMVHAAGALVYCDGANMNAMLDWPGRETWALT